MGGKEGVVLAGAMQIGGSPDAMEDNGRRRRCVGAAMAGSIIVVAICTNDKNPPLLFHR